ncbi:MAG: filamentous hemagglutinin N-terminal domain-containing protein [Nostoc sp.]|uniref:two-partner secretion domain-containing protein n=1 Tax=Nostoc sp. TaxID=1180 RepID=UPI002FF4BB0C
MEQKNSGVAETEEIDRATMLIRILTSSAAIAYILGSTTTAVAQIVPDNSLGAEGSVLTPNVQSTKGQIDRIDGGAIRGSNLFHSFQDLNIGNQQRVYFSNPAGVENILGRVTGNHASNIFGTLGVLGSANLYLINPNGIIFGKNARLDISGSLFASTSNALLFKNGYQFTTQDPKAPPLLTVNLPLGLESWLPPQGAIANSGKLSVGENLTLAGTTLDLQGQLQAGSNLTLQATNTLKVRDSLNRPFIASAKQQLLAEGNQIDIFALNHPSSGFFSGENMLFRSVNPIGGDTHFFSGGNFSLEQINSQGEDLFSFDDPIIYSSGDVSFNSYRGASIHIFAGGSVTINNINVNRPDTTNFIKETVTLSDGVTQVPINGSAQPTVDIRAGTNFNPTGIKGVINVFSPTPNTNAKPTNADIAINQIINSGGLVFLTNQYQPNSSLSGNITVNFALSIFGRGARGGDIVIDSRGKIITPQFLTSLGIDSSRFTFSKPGGNITLLAQDDIVMPPSSRIVSFGTDGGNITLKSQTAIIQQQDPLRESFIESSSYGAGKGGDVTLNAPFIFLSNDVQSNLYRGTTGTTGKLIVTANSLEANQAQLFTRSNGGNANNIIINADSIFLNNSKIGSESIGVNGGKSGDIEINTKSFTATNNSQISSQTEGLGNTGNIVVKATDRVLLSGANTGFFTNTALGSSGNNGNIFVDSQLVDIRDAAAISTNNQGSGIGGNIEIQGNKLTLDNQALISTKTASTEGGNINLQLADSLSLRRESSIVAIAGNETTGGNGANITINTDLLFTVPEENSDITANAFFGDGGKVDISTKDIQGFEFDTLSSLSNITSSSKKLTIPNPPPEVPNPTPEVPNPPPEVLNPPPEVSNPPPEVLNPPPEVPNPPPEVPNPPPEVPNPTPEVPSPVFDFSSLESINKPDAAPSSALIELPNPQSDRENKIVTPSCASTEGNSFTITGRGGLPTDPTATIRGQTILSDTRDFTTTQNSNQTNSSSRILPTRQQIVEATSLIINTKGQVELVAFLPQESLSQKHPNCSDL